MTYEDFMELVSRLLNNLSDLNDIEKQYVLDNAELDTYDINLLEEMIRKTEDKYEVEDFLHCAGIDVYYLIDSMKEFVGIQDKIISGDIVEMF